MTSGNWQRVEEIYHRALEQDPTQREAFVRQACQGDSDLRREVVSLLENQGRGLSGESWAAQAAAQLIDQPTSLQPGQALGPYRIDSFLAAGGMGEVYRATDTRLHREVAIKVSAARFSARFEQEARVIAALNHPGICLMRPISARYPAGFSLRVSARILVSRLAS
jgi:serine/threonine-protein kinase